MRETRAVGRVRRRTWIAASVGAAAMLVLAWQVAALSAVGGVRVAYDAMPVVCEGAEVTLDPPVPDAQDAGQAGYSEEFHSPVVGVMPGMTCGLRLHVINDGWTDVDLSELVLPGMQEEFASPVRPRIVTPNGQVRLPDRDDAAAFDIEGLPLPAGTRQTLTVILDTDEADVDLYGPCSGVTPRGPQVVVSALGTVRAVDAPAEADVSYLNGSQDDCR
jgi:hypothetical protein